MNTPFDDDDLAMVLSPPLLLAREYLDNARRIGAPGSPNMREAGELQQAHADMARTAALVSMAESLHKLAGAAPSDAERKVARALAGSLDTVAKELTKLRSLARKSA